MTTEDSKNIDWQQILRGLLTNKGVTVTTLAAHAKMSNTAMRRLKCGDVDEPKYDAGCRLLAMQKLFSLNIGE